MNKNYFVIISKHYSRIHKKLGIPIGIFEKLDMSLDTFYLSITLEPIHNFLR